MEIVVCVMGGLGTGSKSECAHFLEEGVNLHTSLARFVCGGDCVHSCLSV